MGTMRMVHRWVVLAGVGMAVLLQTGCEHLGPLTGQSGGQAPHTVTMPASSWSPRISCSSPSQCSVVYMPWLEPAVSNSAALRFGQCTNDDCSGRAETLFSTGAVTSGLNIFGGRIACPAADNCKILLYKINAWWQSWKTVFIDCDNVTCSQRTEKEIGDFGPYQAMDCPTSDDCKVLFLTPRLTDPQGMRDLVFIDCDGEVCKLNEKVIIEEAYVGGTSAFSLDCPTGDDCKIVFTPAGTDGTHPYNLVDCEDAKCQTYNEVRIVTTLPWLPNSNASHLSISCATGDACRIAYVGYPQNFSDGFLGFTRCQSASCDQHTDHLIPIYSGEPQGSVSMGGWTASMACPTANNCKIVYRMAYQSGEYPLKFVDCDNDTCSTGTVRRLQSVGMRMEYPYQESIVCPASNRCRIAGHDGVEGLPYLESGAARIITCYDETCGSGGVPLAGGGSSTPTASSSRPSSSRISSVPSSIRSSDIASFPASSASAGGGASSVPSSAIASSAIASSAVASSTPFVPPAASSTQGGGNSTPTGPGWCGDGIASYPEECGEPGLFCSTGLICQQCQCYSLTQPNYSSAAPSTNRPNAVCHNGRIEPGEECGEPGYNCAAGFTCHPSFCICQPIPKQPSQGPGQAFSSVFVAQGNTSRGYTESPGQPPVRPAAPAIVCGDGVRAGQEQCDDGNLLSTDSCTAQCRIARCGDGIVQEGVEECDDGNRTNTDGCTNACRFPFCGDGITTKPEECDDANAVETDGCRTRCKRPRCGDGMVDPGEQCDDANTFPNDGCDARCRVERCGDGIVQVGEECDDGNTRATDLCTDLCERARCGDGVVRTGIEACDMGLRNSNTLPDTCRVTCTLPRCGDGVKDSPEECDDGGNQAGDGCSARCRWERRPDEVAANVVRDPPLQAQVQQQTSSVPVVAASSQRRQEAPAIVVVPRPVPQPRAVDPLLRAAAPLQPATGPATAILMAAGAAAGWAWTRRRR